MRELSALKNIVMTPLIRVLIHHPNLMRSKPFLKAMQVFPQKISASYDARMKNTEGHYQEVLAEGLRLVDSDPRTILDLGTGTGLAAFAAAGIFPKARIIGVDQSEGMLSLARDKRSLADGERISFTQGNACNLAYADQSFDLVLSSNAPIYLDEASRVLKTRGHLMVAFSFAGAAFTKVEADIRDLLKPYGLELEYLKIQTKGVVVIARKHVPWPE